MNDRHNHAGYGWVKPLLTTLALLTTATLGSAAPIVVTQHHQVYSQDFDVLGSVSQDWANDLTLPAWYLQRTTGLVPTTLAVSHGNAGGVNHFNFGPSGGADRALGGQPGTAGPNDTGFAWGVRVTNNGSVSIGAIDVTFDAEQWRRSGTVANDIQFYYRVGGTSFDLGTNPGSWTIIPTLDFTSPQLGAAAILDGNAAANRMADIYGRVFLDVPVGTDVWLGWSIDFVTDGNHGMAIDNLELEFLLPEPASAVVLAVAVVVVAGRRQQKAWPLS